MYLLYFASLCLRLNRQIKALKWAWPTAKYITPRVCLQASCRYVQIWIRIRLGASKSITAESFFRALHADAGGRTDSLKVNVADMKWDLILSPKETQLKIKMQIRDPLLVVVVVVTVQLEGWLHWHLIICLYNSNWGSGFDVGELADI